MNIKYCALSVVIVATVTASSVVMAGSTCYDDTDYPFAKHLEGDSEGVSFMTLPLSETPADVDRNQWFKVTGDSTGFSVQGSERCEMWGCPGKQWKNNCPSEIPPIRVDPSVVPASVARNFDVDKLHQQPSACVSVDDEVYFGLAFYGGEGMMGVGGVGRWNKKTGELEVRHPLKLRESSVNYIAHDGKRLWLGTHYTAECHGDIPTERVLVYDWGEDRWEGQNIPNLLTCGFIANGFYQESPEYMWIASDLGISRVKVVEEAYFGMALFGATHWWAEETATGVQMREGTCEELYDKLLLTLPMKLAPTYTSPLLQFTKSLHEFNPRYVMKKFVDEVVEDRGLERVTVAYRHIEPDVLLQNCETGELFLPTGDAWLAMSTAGNGVSTTAPNTPVRYPTRLYARVTPEAGGDPYRRLEIVEIEGGVNSLGFCDE